MTMWLCWWLPPAWAMAARTRARASRSRLARALPLDVPDTAGNAAELGRPGSGRGEGGGAFPQLRLVGLAECGTHTCFAAAMGAYRTGETTLAAQLTTALGEDMLVFADRNFLSHRLLTAFVAAGAQVCWRAKRNAVLPVLER